MDRTERRVLKEIPSLFPDGSGRDLTLRLRNVSWQEIHDALYHLKERGLIRGEPHYGSHPAHADEWMDVELTVNGRDALGRLAFLGVPNFLREHWYRLISAIALLLSIYNFFAFRGLLP